MHSPQQIKDLLSQVGDIMSEYYTDPESTPAPAGVTKTEMVHKFSEAEIPETGIGLQEVLDIFKKEVVPATVKTWHPLFLNQMTAGAPVPSVVAEMFSSMLNTTMATWEMSPASTIIEREVSRWMAQILGMPEGSSGIFLPGGSLSNQLALTVARHQKLDPHIAARGIQNVPIHGAILCSEGAHYSVANAANLLGIGTDQVIKVKSNDRYEMEIDDIARKLKYCDEHNLKPFAIVSTMGLTVTGGFDPLGDIVHLCRDRDIHIHVDAAFGGGMGLTSRGEQFFRGIEHADTVLWDAHKWFHVPLTCTVLLAPDARIFHHTFSSNADYLFHPQEEDINIADDLGQYTILCGKRFDALAIWLLFKAWGSRYFSEMAESRVRLVEDFHTLLINDPDFVPTYQPVSPIQCFRYLPEGSDHWPLPYRDKLHRWVRETCKKRRIAMYNITKYKGEDHFRMILINPLTTMDHLTTLLDQIREISREFVVNNPVPEPATSIH